MLNCEEIKKKRRNTTPAIKYCCGSRLPDQNKKEIDRIKTATKKPKDFIKIQPETRNLEKKFDASWAKTLRKLNENTISTP